MAAERDSKGRFVKGHAKKGGSKAGESSYPKKELRLVLREYSVEHFNDFVFAMKNLEPKDFCRFYLETLKFNLPLLQAVTLDSGEKAITIEGYLRDLAQKKKK